VPGLRLGTFVLAAPMRPPRSAAWEGHSLTALTGDRFEFGIGTGRPDARAEVAQLGLPWGTGAQRLDLVRDTVAHLRRPDGDRHTPVLMAASGPQAITLAAAEADIVTLAVPPRTAREEVRRLAGELRGLAGDRDPELAMNAFLVGDAVPPWAERILGADPALPAVEDTMAVLRGGVVEMADELRRRRDSLGVSYIVVGEAFADDLAPVVELLAGT
jgi:alkanesulfonate monooxygenase SsuD/methylene tetrahydromethanopterin reductase-like flavin-dependent oxidoreductase (luciferase family)